MKYMTGNEIRKAYLQFFKSKEHLILHSFPLIPENDPSLLLIGAGMAPLKPYFTGKLVPPSYRVTTSQKCIRTGDIDNVGRTARHHTFFEMLGNFSRQLFQEGSHFLGLGIFDRSTRTGQEQIIRYHLSR